MNAIPNLIPGAPTTLGSRFPGQIRRYSGVKLIATQSKQESDLGWPRCVCVCELWLWTQTLWTEFFFVWPVSISLILHWLRPSTEVHMDKRFLDKFCCSEDLSVVWNMRTSYVQPEEGKRSELTIIFSGRFQPFQPREKLHIASWTSQVPKTGQVRSLWTACIIASWTWARWRPGHGRHGVDVDWFAVRLWFSSANFNDMFRCSI